MTENKKAIIRKNISIVLFSVWCTISGAMFGIGIDIENSILKIVGGINLIIIMFLILYKTGTPDEDK